jgi:hypothetical protein
MLKILKEKIVRKEGKDCRLYLVRFKNCPADQDLWLEQDKIDNASTLLRQFRSSKRTKNSN